ncbi:MAG TPA: hypothetical protein VM344_02355 [Vitreimonas sp.]|nr:hypothetical protein [Vitreimonas sp.]
MPYPRDTSVSASARAARAASRCAAIWSSTSYHGLDVIDARRLVQAQGFYSQPGAAVVARVDRELGVAPKREESRSAAKAAGRTPRNRVPGPDGAGGNLMRMHETSRNKLAETQKRDADDGG